MFEDCVETFEGYSAVDDILAQCEAIGAGLQQHISRWQGAPRVKGKAPVTGTKLDEDAFEDGALTIRNVNNVNSKDFLSKQPASMTKDIKLKDYQLLGLNWLRLMHLKGHSGILADEMGESPL